MFIKKIMASIYRGGMEAEEAAFALGLLIEREKRRTGNNDGTGIYLGERLANRRLSETELTNAVDALIKYIEETTEPHPRAVWALTRSHEPRTVRPLINLLNRFLTSPGHEDLAYQALVGVIPLQTEKYRAAIRAAILRAAEQGHDEVRETAIDHLELSLTGDAVRGGLEF